MASFYLHLFWENYAKNIDSQDILEKAKSKIDSRFRRLQTESPLNLQEKQMIEGAYTLADEDFRKAIEEELSNSDYPYAPILEHIDSLAKQLSTAIKGKGKTGKELEIVQDCIQTLDHIIRMSEGVMDRSTISMLKNLQNKTEELEAKGRRYKNFFARKNKGKSKGFTALNSLQRSMTTTIAGYAFEIFAYLAYLDASIYGNTKIAQEIEKTLVHTGIKYDLSKMDPEVQKILQDEVAEINKEQSKADITRFFFNPQNGTGRGELKIFTETMQAKNVNLKKSSRIRLGKQFTEHPLSNLNFQGDSIWGPKGGGDFYPEEFIIHAAGALSGNQKLTGANSSEINRIAKSLNLVGDITQTQLALQWQEIVKQVSALSVLDAIGGKRLLNNAKYYIVRNKHSKGVRILSSYDIVENIADYVRFGNFKVNNIPMRYIFSDINEESFVNNEQSNKIRSDKAISAIRSKINEAKVSVSLNANIFK